MYNVDAERDQGTGFFLTRCRKSSKRRYTILSFFAFVFWLTWQTQEFCIFTVEAKITGVHPEATIMIAAELRGSGSYLDRTMRNGMSFSNQTFAAFLYFCSNIPVLYQEKSLTKRSSSPILSLLAPFVTILFFFFFHFHLLLKKDREQKNGKK